MAITSTTRLKAYLGIPAGLTFHDTALGYAASAADAVVLGMLGQASLAVLTVQEYPEVYRANQTVVMLRHAPVSAVAVVTNGGSLVGASDYRVDSDKGELTLTADCGDYWSTDRDGVQVLYGYGYTSGTLPAEVVHAADVLGASYFKRTPRSGLDSEDIGGYKVAMSSVPMPPEVVGIMARHQNLHR